ncbi:anillin, actin binding protein 2 isoform X2 [Gouania willdenowi]|uniref:Anillin-like n=1 Tax=Gouania willdenowi TaxID=441366 RepID=A0A8C5DJV7_GOUWI|nr:anillin-like isoform X2 [Gouania willdenowi]
MEGMEEKDGTIPLKRQREPLSDSDDVNFLAPEEPDGQKRRRLEATGQENRTPKTTFSSGRLLELQTKPDTPIVPSVHSRVLQLSQSIDGGFPSVSRCLSDPGGEDEIFREPLLSKREFNQRMERFKVPVVQDSPSSSPNNSRFCSDFVSAIQQKLQGSTTPSSKQESRMRQEREQELSLLHLQPITENAWLKRSTSDPSLNERWTPVLASLSSSWVPRTKRKFLWPPTKPWEQVSGDEEIKDDSFSEASTSGADSNVTGGTARDVTTAPVASLRLGNVSDKHQQRAIHDAKRLRKEEEPVVLHNDEEQSSTQHPETLTVQKLSFSEDLDFSKSAFNEDLMKSELEGSLALASPCELIMKEKAEQSPSEVFSIDEDEKTEESSYDMIEPSTDEELRIWKYPPFSVYVDEETGIDDEAVHAKVPISTDLHADVSIKTHHLSQMLADENRQAEADKFVQECCADEGDNSALNMETSESMVDANLCSPKKKLDDTEGQTHVNDKSKRKNVLDPQLDWRDSEKCKQMESSLYENASQTLTEMETYQAPPYNVDENDKAQTFSEIQMSHQHDTGMQADIQDDAVEQISDVSRGESSKKVNFSLEPDLINISMDSTAATTLSDAELSSNETNAAEIIDQMFDEVLEYAEKMEDEQQDNEDTEERDSGIYTCSGDKVQAENNADKGRCEEKCQANTSECDERKAFESTSDELLGFPPTGILSPLSKSIESAVTPLRLAASQESNPPPLLQTPEESSEQPKESAPLYSIDAYRTQRQSKLRTIQSVTPGVQRRAAEMSIPQPSVNSKEKITALNDDSAKLQIVINQTLQALSCCTDEEHGRGSLEEAEAEKLLLVSCEKRSALLAEVTRLREQRSSESAEATEEHDYVSQQPCRGTVSITNIQLPLKVEFVCSSHNRPGRPSHYFFVLIRYGSCTVVATPLATAADAKNGDTISFPTVVTLKDIHSSFEIDVEVYSLDNTSGPHCSTDRASTKSRVTPRKLLNTLTRSSNTLTPVALPALKTRRSSNFCLVGSHKLTLASFGHNKFPLDKVPFLSPLEGNIYLQLDSVSHSNVLHQGFLTMFELVSGYGVWNRRYFLLEGCNMYYWNHPNDREIKEAEGCLSLFSFPSQCVRPVKRDSCARPFTFELVNNAPQLQQDNNQDGLAKCWFSADTKQDRLDWMEKLSQALLDFHTWNRTPMDSETSNMSTSGSLRESLL